MPIRVPIKLRRLDYDEFSKAAYEVMEVVFAIHKEFGRLFDEAAYQYEIASRFAGSAVEVPVEVSFGSFCKKYYLDFLWAGGAVFEFKAVEKLVDRHRAQLLHYLLLTDLLHGKLVNMRLESVEHEFVNAAFTRADRVRFAIGDNDFVESTCSRVPLQEIMVSLLRDWGVGLDIELYEEALTHFLGGEAAVLQQIEVRAGGRVLRQAARMVGPNASFRISALNEGLQRYESHLRRFLARTTLDCFQWVNVGRKVVTFKTLRR